MGLQGEDHTSRGDIMRRLRDQDRRIAQLETARRLESASIGAGGLRVKDGGAITILDADGEPALTLSADDGLRLAGLLTMLAGANIQTEDADGRLRAEIGDVIFVHGADGDRIEVNGNGIVLRDTEGEVVGFHQSTGFMVAFTGSTDRALSVSDVQTLLRYNAAAGNSVAVLLDDDLVFQFPDGTVAQRVSDDRWAVAYPDVGGAGTAVEITDEVAVTGPGGRGVVIRVNEAEGLRLAVDTDGAGVQSGQVTAGPADSAGAGFRQLRIPN